MKYIFLLILLNIMQIKASDWKHIEDLDTKFNDVFSISCPDSNNCFVLAQSTNFFRFYKSTDQGLTWNISYQSDPFNEPQPYLVNTKMSISPSPDYHIVVMYEEAILLKSTDGGFSFERIILDTLDGKQQRKIFDIAMFDTNKGMAVSGDYYFVTRDSWKTFEKFPKTYFETVYSLKSINDSILISTFSKYMDTTGFKFRVYNFNHNSWDVKFAFPPNTGDENPYIILNLFAVNNSLIFGSGYQRTGIGANKYDIIYRTLDGGVTWKLILKELVYPSYGLQDISFHDARNGVAVGQGGKIWTTNDSGNTWVNNELPPEMVEPLTMKVAWAGQIPLIGTFNQGGGLFRYEGDFFDFTPDPVFPKIHTDGYDFGSHDTSFMEGISAKLKIYNKSDIMDLIINHYSAMTDSAFSSDLPAVDSLNPIVIKPLGFFEYTVSFKSNEIKEYRDSIVFFSNAKDSDNVAYLNGKGIDTIEVGVDERTIQKRINVLQSGNKLLISIQDEKFRKYKLQIFDILGNVVKEEELNSGIGSLFVPVDISILSNGVYLFSINVDGISVKSDKFQIIR